ncbi:MAG TPA: hypothetical protein VHI77_08395 [Solirubrobacterales bacterium]|jgi:hypothetical protein|nr:hypothetical protein [Solirubrobacterales bacterium]
MSRHRAAIALTALLGLLSAAPASAGPIQEENLIVKFDGDFSPHALPRHRAVPIEVQVDGSIRTTDGSRPPALQRLQISLNRHGVLTTRGLPVCREAELQSTTSEVAMERCGAAIVGSGSFGAGIYSPSDAPVPVSGRILAFNGEQGGRRVILLHLYGTLPITATFILPLKISHASDGEFGTVLAARIPKIAGGTGSITSIHLKIGRRYSYRGRRLAFVSASCAAPAGFNLAPFSFARANFYLAGKRLGTTVVRYCRVR